MKKLLLCLFCITIILLSGCTIKGADIINQEECTKDCKALGLEYFKGKYATGGMFSRTQEECWCREGNESKRIW